MSKRMSLVQYLVSLVLCFVITGISPGVKLVASTFPIGLACVDSETPYRHNVIQEFPDIAAAGFNLIHAYVFEGDIHGPVTTIAEAIEYLDAADRSGLKVLMGIPRACVLNRNLACIREPVSALRDHRALFGWELFDEPDTPLLAPTCPPDTLALAYNTIKQLDPNHPVAIASFLVIDGSYRYFSGFDIFMSGYLRITTEPLVAGITPNTDAARIVTRPRGKSVMTHIIVYNPANDFLIWPPELPRMLGRYPTREEIRFMAYYAVLRGAEGLFFNCYRFDYLVGPTGRDDVSRRNNPSQWAVVSSVAAELRSMAPILEAAKQDLQRVGITIGGITPIEMMAKQYQGKTYLLTANPAIHPVELPIHLDSSLYQNPIVTLLPEQQRIPVQDGSFTARWGANGVRIYEIASGGQQRR